MLYNNGCVSENIDTDRGYILMNSKKPYRAAEAVVISVNKADVIRTSIFFGPEDELFGEGEETEE